MSPRWLVLPGFRGSPPSLLHDRASHKTFDTQPCSLARAADEGKVPIQRLQQHAAGLLARVEATQRGLRSVLSAAIQQRLAAVHWPPPLTVSGASGGAAGAADNGGAWRGFAAASPAAAGELQQLLVVLLTLQRASQHEQFAALTEASQEGPLLWAAEELVAPLAERLRHHFASGLPTDRPDRPEWLFATALKAAQQCAPLAQELQPVVGAWLQAAVAAGLPWRQWQGCPFSCLPRPHACTALQTRISCSHGTACL